MAHSYANNLIHLVFSTKERRRLIASGIKQPLYEFIVGVGANHGILVFGVGGMEDHLHVLYALPSSMSLAESIQKIKANSSRWIGDHGIDFAWQQGYGAFSVSASNKTAVLAYIAGQEEHHRKQTFDEEFISLLKKHQMKYDPKDVLG